jgi:hypothetical protein
MFYTLLLDQILDKNCDRANRSKSLDCNEAADYSSFRYTVYTEFGPERLGERRVRLGKDMQLKEGVKIMDTFAQCYTVFIPLISGAMTDTGGEYVSIYKLTRSRS